MAVEDGEYGDRCVETDKDGRQCVNKNPFHTRQHENESGQKWSAHPNHCAKTRMHQTKDDRRCLRDEGHGGECRYAGWKAAENVYSPTPPPETAGRYEPSWKIAGFDDEAAYEKYKKWLETDKI